MRWKSNQDITHILFHRIWNNIISSSNLDEIFSKPFLNFDHKNVTEKKASSSMHAHFAKVVSTKTQHKVCDIRMKLNRKNSASIVVHILLIFTTRYNTQYSGLKFEKSEI